MNYSCHLGYCMSQIYTYLLLCRNAYNMKIIPSFWLKLKQSYVIKATVVYILCNCKYILTYLAFTHSGCSVLLITGNFAEGLEVNY